MSHHSFTILDRPGRFLATASLAAGALLLFSADSRAQCCCGGQSGSRALSAQALQAQILQAQLVQAHLLQAQVSQAALLNHLNALHAGQRAGAGAPHTSQNLTPQMTARPDAAKISDEAAAAALAKELTRGTPAQRQRALATLKDREGEAFTRALANAVPKLTGDLRNQARAALAERATPSRLPPEHGGPTAVSK